MLGQSTSGDIRDQAQKRVVTKSVRYRTPNIDRLLQETCERAASEKDVSKLPVDLAAAAGKLLVYPLTGRTIFRRPGHAARHRPAGQTAGGIISVPRLSTIRRTAAAQPAQAIVGQNCGLAQFIAAFHEIPGLVIYSPGKIEINGCRK